MRRVYPRRFAANPHAGPSFVKLPLANLESQGGNAMKRTFRPRVTTGTLVRVGVVGAVLAAGAGAGSLAYATVFASQTVIHGCYARTNGVLRIANRCSKAEKALTWNN